MYQIVRYAFHEEAGTRSYRLPMTYSSARLAHKLAERRSNAEYEMGGDDHFGVVHAGTWTRHYEPFVLELGECPF